METYLNSKKETTPATKQTALTIILAILRGLLKCIPLVNPLIEAFRTIKSEGKAHNWASIITQVLGLIAILWAFYQKAVTIEDVINFLKGIK